ncbi:MAG TPA: antibiotic biosynthesis monooxygenase [Dysgonomonas sp.]|nr:antibiotic biosynthesis monooxygenase [Dysgonomonas sp.]
MNELKIIAVVTLKEEFKEDILKALHNVVDATRKEEGNISYELHENISNPLEMNILEVWKSQDAIDSHNAATHFNDFVKAIEGKVDGLKIDVIRKIY